MVGRVDGFCWTGATRRVGQWQWRVLGWPELATAASEAAAGARPRASMAQEQACKCVEGLGGLLEAPEARCSARPRVVQAQATAATKPGGGELRSRRERCYDMQMTMGAGGKGEWLTALAMEGSAWSGKLWRWRIDDGALR